MFAENFNYWGTGGDEVAPVSWWTGESVTWWPVQEVNFHDTTVDYAGNSLTSWIPMTAQELVEFERAAALSALRTSGDDTWDE